MMQFLTQIRGQGAAPSIWETSVVPGSSMPLISNTVLTPLAGLFIFPRSFPWKLTFERYHTRKTSSEKFLSERELVSSFVLWHSRLWGLSQWPIPGVSVVKYRYAETPWSPLPRSIPPYDLSHLANPQPWLNLFIHFIHSCPQTVENYKSQLTSSIINLCYSASAAH